MVVSDRGETANLAERCRAYISVSRMQFVQAPKRKWISHIRLSWEMHDPGPSVSNLRHLRAARPFVARIRGGGRHSAVLPIDNGSDLCVPKKHKARREDIARSICLFLIFPLLGCPSAPSPLSQHGRPPDPNPSGSKVEGEASKGQMTRRDPQFLTLKPNIIYAHSSEGALRVGIPNSAILSGGSRPNC